MRILYHFRHSVFARRARLALAHKGIPVELREAREHPEHGEAVRRLAPYLTIPVLVEEDGRALGDSTAISHYLDRAYADLPRLWPLEPEHAFAAFETAALVDHALESLVAAGNRFFKLHDDARWPEVQEFEVRRIQRALDALAERATGLAGPTWLPVGWSAVDIWVYTAVAWLRGLPARRHMPVPGQILSLGWKLPDELSRWADQHTGRVDVVALETI